MTHIVGHCLNLLGKLDGHSCNSPNATASEGLCPTLVLADGWRLPFVPSPQRSKICLPPSIPTFFVTPFEISPNLWLRAKTAEH